MKIILSLTLVAFAACACAQPKHKKSPPLAISNKNNLVISGYSINGGAVDCIHLWNCNNVRITRCKLQNSKQLGIELWNCKNVVIEDCYISNVKAGVVAYSSTTIKVNKNHFLNMNGPFPSGNFVQFNNVSGGGNQINYNKCVDIAGEAEHPQDGLSVYKSNGLPGDSIQVIGNWIKGGQVINDSGGGAAIVLGDVGGSYQVARDNVVVNGGYVGIQVQGGSHIKMDHNTIYSSKTDYSNCGLVYGNYSGQPSTDVEISYNKVRYFDRKGNEDDAWWDPKTVTKPIGWETNILKADIDEKILPERLFEKQAEK